MGGRRCQLGDIRGESIWSFTEREIHRIHIGEPIGTHDLGVIVWILRYGVAPGVAPGVARLVHVPGDIRIAHRPVGRPGNFVADSHDDRVHGM